MPRDVQELLRRTADEPTHALDTADVVGRARRRTLVTRASLGLAAVVAVLIVGGIVLPLPLGGDRGLEIAEQPEGDGPPPADEPSDEGEPPEATEDDGTASPGAVTDDPGDDPIGGPPRGHADAVERHQLDMPSALELRLVAVGGHPLQGQLVSVDLARQETTVYPSGTYGPAADAIDAAALTSEGTVVVAQGRVITAFRDGEDEPRVVHRPALINEPGSAPSVSLVAALDAEQVWLVQVGSGGRPGTAELLDLEIGEVLLQAELPSDTHPAASTASGLVLNEGWRAVLTLTTDGQLTELTEGEAVAAPGDWVAVRRCETDVCELSLHHIESGERREVTKPVDGSWIGVAGPSVPTRGPRWWPAATGGGQLLVGIETEVADGQGADDRAGHLVVIDPEEPDAATVVWDFDGIPTAAWSRDGAGIVLVDRAWDTSGDLTIIDLRDGSTAIVSDAIPPGHVVITAG